MTTQVIPDCIDEGDPIQHIQKNESSLLGRTSYDNQFTLLFPTTLSGNVSYWCFGLPKLPISSYADLKIKFI